MSEATMDFQKLGVDFQNSLKDFMESSDGLSKNQLKRVLKALAAYPLEEGIVNLIHEDELSIYKIGTEIQSIKINMMVESLRQDAEEERVKEAKAARNAKT